MFVCCSVELILSL